MKLVQKIIVILCALLVFACGGGGGGGSSGGGGNNNSTVLPNGSIVTAAQSSVTTFTGGSTSNTISISGGTSMPVTVNTNSQIQTFNVTAKGKLLSDSGIKVTTNPSPLVLISGGSQSSGQIIVDAANASTGNYLVNVYGSFINPNTGQQDSMLIAQFSVSVSKPTPSDVIPGSLSSSPNVINLSESNNKTAEMIVSLDGSQNINNLAVTIDSSDTGVVLSKSTCTLSSSSNTCQITVNGVASTNALANISVKASGYQTTNTVVHIDDPKPVVVYGTISIAPNSLSLFPQESGSFSITWSGSQNINELPIVISGSGNVVTLNKDSCLLTPTINSCTVSVIGEIVGNADLSIQVSTPELASHYPVQNVAVEVNQQAYGSLSLTPQNQAVYVGQNGSLTLTWNDSVGISSLPIMISSSSNDIQLNTTSCNLTSENNSCEIQFSGLNIGSAEVTVTPTNPSQASHFTPQTAMIQVSEVKHNQLLVTMNQLISNEQDSLDPISLVYSRSQNLPGDLTASIRQSVYAAIGNDLIVFDYPNVYRGNSVTSEWRRLGRKDLNLQNKIIAINPTGDRIVVSLKNTENNIISYGLYLYNEITNDWDILPNATGELAQYSQSMVYRGNDLYVLVYSTSYSAPHYIAKLSNGALNWESIPLPTSDKLYYNRSDAIFVDKQGNLYYTKVSSVSNSGPVVYRLNSSTNQWDKLSGDGPDGSIAAILGGYVQYLTSDSKGNLIVNVFELSNRERLYQYNTTTQKWSQYGYQSFDHYDNEMLGGVPTIAVDKNDTVYFTYAQGIFKATSTSNLQSVVNNAGFMKSIVMSDDGLMNFTGGFKYGFPDLNKQTNATDWSADSIRILGPKGKLTGGYSVPDRGIITYNNVVYVSPFGQIYLLGRNYPKGTKSFTLALWDDNSLQWLNKNYDYDGYTTSSSSSISVTSYGLTYLGIGGGNDGHTQDARILSSQSSNQPLQFVQEVEGTAVFSMASDTCGNTYFTVYSDNDHGGDTSLYQINANGQFLPMSTISSFDPSRVYALATDYACNVYVGTDNGGIYRHNSTAPLSDWQLMVGINNVSVRKILFNRNNEMFLETVQKALPYNVQIATYQSNQITYLSMPETIVENKGKITDFAITYDGSLYVGTNNSNVWQYDFANANWIYTKYGNGMGSFMTLSAN